MFYGLSKRVLKGVAVLGASLFCGLAQGQQGIPDTIQLDEEIPAYSRLSTVSYSQPQAQVVPVQYQTPVPAPSMASVPSQGVPVYTPDGSAPEGTMADVAMPVEEAPMAEAPCDSLFLDEFCAPVCQPSCGGLLGPGCLFVEGYVDQGFNVNSNKNKENLPMATNDMEGYQLNQVYLSFGRRVIKADQWAVGGQIDVMFGTDYYYMTSTGLETSQTNAQHWNGTEKDGDSYRASRSMYGMALPQAYAEIYAPIMAGVDVKVGHFNSVMGFESNQATNNFFYSRSYQSVYGMPTSMTGVMSDWKVTENWSILAGGVNEWNAFNTPENHFSFVVGATYENYAGNFAFSAVVMNGKQSAASFQADDYASEGTDTTVLNLLAKYKFTDRLAYVAEFTYGNNKAEVFDMQQEDSFKGRNWYGFSNYLFYCLNDHLTLGARFEWFHDKENTVIGGGYKTTFTNVPANYFSWSFGANWDPLTWLTVRPEIRWDYCDLEFEALDQKYYAFDRNTSNYQFTVGCDAIIRF